MGQHVGHQGKVVFIARDDAMFNRELDTLVDIVETVLVVGLGGPALQVGFDFLLDRRRAHLGREPRAGISQVGEQSAVLSDNGTFRTWPDGAGMSQFDPKATLRGMKFV